MINNEKALHLIKQSLYLKFREQNQESVSLMLAYDEALIALCAERLDERGHHHAANSLRKMAREGRIP